MVGWVTDGSSGLKLKFELFFCLFTWKLNFDGTEKVSKIIKKLRD